MELNNTKYGFFKSTVNVFIFKILGAGLAFFNQIMISRAIGIQLYGTLGIFLSVANILTILPLVGMDTGLIRSIAVTSSKGEKKWLIFNTLKIMTMLLFIIIIILLFTNKLFFWKLGLDSKLVMYLILYIAVMGYSTILDSFLQGEKKTVIANAFSPLFNNLIKVIVFSIIFTITHQLTDTVMVLILVEFVLLIIRFIYIFKDFLNVKYPIKIKSDSRAEIINYLKYCSPLFLVAGIGILHATINKFIVSIMMGNFDVGVLRVFENYSAILGLFVAPFITMWPIMSEYFSKNKMHELKELFEQSTMVIAVLTLPTFIILIVSTNQILSIFGINVTELKNIKLILFIFFLGIVFDAIVGPAGALLNMTKYSKLCLINNLVLLFSSVVLSITLIPRYGLMGAAIASSTSKIIINILNVIQNKRIFGIFPYTKIHLLIILFGFPIYYAGSKLYTILNTGIVFKIATTGITIYIAYFMIFGLLYRKNITKFTKIFLHKYC